ncbi:MAG: 50S ribosomal protein L29 [Steroidobacteraceae bacterium]|jgi:large subunit ribosomal protein L29|nr:50S ribosomal protein L29 [Steroidobacteraceae bacterium]
MNPNELRKKSQAELKDELIKLRREQFNLRMAAAAGQPARPDQYGKVRKNVARVKTVLNELERAKSAGSEG